MEFNPVPNGTHTISVTGYSSSNRVRGSSSILLKVANGAAIAAADSDAGTDGQCGTSPVCSCHCKATPNPGTDRRHHAAIQRD